MAGVGRELARMVLPLNIYTRWVWKCDLKNLLHLLRLRCDGHAQYEIRVYADAIANVVELLFPAAWKSWKDNYMDGVSLSGIESRMLQQIASGLNAAHEAGYETYAQHGWSTRRLNEFIDKADKLLPASSKGHLLGRTRSGWEAAKVQAKQAT